MSRSYHITKAQAVKRYLLDGDSEAVQDSWQKQTVKKAVRKFRPVYDQIHPSAKPTNKLRGSVAHRAVRDELKRKMGSKKGGTSA